MRWSLFFTSNEWMDEEQYCEIDGDAADAVAAEEAGGWLWCACPVWRETARSVYGGERR